MTARLVSAEDGLGALFHARVSRLVEEVLEGEEAGGRRPGGRGRADLCYDGPRRDFLEAGVQLGAEAASRGTNLVLTWDEAGQELVAFFAEDEAGARRGIAGARKALLALRRRARGPARARGRRK